MNKNSKSKIGGSASYFAFLRSFLTPVARASDRLEGDAHTKFRLRGKWEGVSSLQNFQKREWWDFLAVCGLIVALDVRWEMRIKRQGNIGQAVGW